ncbi:MAG: ATP-binding cassette domain-containing protein [Cyanobacteria bacterium]|nr:ATP-binding cassette domain-containing protein [Cyanobacteriota bacterium]
MSQHSLVSDRRPSADSRDVIIRRLSAGYVTGTLRERRMIARELDITLPSGRIVALVGPNGSGKSTILRAIVDSRFRLEGSVQCGNAPLHPADIAFMPQGSGSTLFPWRTGAQNVTLWDEIHGAPKRDSASTLATRYGITVPLERRVSELSGGERVQVALLRALNVPNRKLIVLDEPTEGLDSRNRSLLLAILERLASEGTPIIITTHRTDDIKAIRGVAFSLVGSPIHSLKEVQLSSTPRDEKDNGEDFGGSRSLSDSFADQNDTRKVLIGTLGIMMGLLAWATASVLVGRPSLIPGPFSVLREMLTLVADGSLVRDVSTTVLRAMGGWVLGLAVAIPFGTLLGYHRDVYRFVSPWLSLARGFPVFTLTGLAIGLFVGANELQRLFLIVLTVLLIALQIVSSAAYTAPRRRVELARVFGAGELFCLMRVMFFESIGGILAALETTLPLAIVLTLVIESFLIPDVGLGRFVLNSLQGASVAVTIAAVFWPALVAAIGVAVIRRFARRWQFEL